MSVVFRAHDHRLGRTVALKVMSDELAQDREFRRRFEAEARSAAAIDHPNVIPIYEAGETGGVLYLAMRLVDGNDLSTILADEGKLDLQRTFLLLDQVAAALDAAHERGLIHRDVKPGNVLVARKAHVYLCDFGLTKRSSGHSSFTRTGQVVGTPSYLAPEQIEGRHIDSRADVYALGCMLFECLTGSAPFDGENEVAILYAHVHRPPPRLSDLRPELPRAFDDVLARSLAKDPSDRYQTAGDLMGAAHAATAGAWDPYAAPTVVRKRANAPSGRSQHDAAAMSLAPTGAGQVTGAWVAERAPSVSAEVTEPDLEHRVRERDFATSELRRSALDAESAINPVTRTPTVDVTPAPAHADKQRGPERRYVLAVVALVVAVVGAYLVARLTSNAPRLPYGHITEFATPTRAALPNALATGRDGDLWLTETNANKVASVDMSGHMREFALPTAGSGPYGITSGPGGEAWLTEVVGNKIAEILPNGHVTEFPLPNTGALAQTITRGADGAFWFTEFGHQAIGRVIPAGLISEYPTGGSLGGPYGITAAPNGQLAFGARLDRAIGYVNSDGSVRVAARLGPGAGPYDLATGPDGALWFTETGPSRIGRLDPSTGTVTQFALPNPNAAPEGIVAGPDGNLWFAETRGNAIGRISLGGAIREFSIPTPSASPLDVAFGSDGNVWFTESTVSKIGRLTVGKQGTAPR